ncbi:hypothetical protein BDA99DRAFT_559474 [Phascolomyces articulosus]|uniref:Uncharacterized protein n=1 Tax=Phascolomyces articulosus TaxID=60185 RepID=A0AAD5K129_9FUNG|nr:hypothetical protein BDA99DRAFT_559474 [Phascolomyces articulosus]
MITTYSDFIALLFFLFIVLPWAIEQLKLVWFRFWYPPSIEATMAMYRAKYAEVVLEQIALALKPCVLPEQTVVLSTTPVVVAATPMPRALPARQEVRSIERSSYCGIAKDVFMAKNKSPLVMPVRRAWTDVSVHRARRAHQVMPTWHDSMEIHLMHIDDPIDELVVAGHRASWTGSEKRAFLASSGRACLGPVGMLWWMVQLLQ